MVEITVSGTLEELHSKLEVVKAITSMRNEFGWRLFQSDEDWDYETKKDEAVCYICNSFAGPWNGAQIPVEFQYWKRLEKNEVYPNTHDSYTFLRGECRCSLFWFDYFFVLRQRLWREIEEVSI